MRGVLILNDNYTYEGEIKMNKPHGDGLFIYANGHTYEGHCLLGKPDGFGVYTYDETTAYEGYFSSGKFHGIGTFENAEQITKGTWRNDRRHGFFIKTTKATYITVKQLWIKGVLVSETETEYVQPRALFTTKNNPAKKEKIYQVNYRGQEKKCIGCTITSANATNIACGHVCMCYDCLSKCDKCPICRTNMTRIIRLFVS